MAYGDVSYEIGGRVLTFPTNLAFDATVAGGNANLDKAVTLSSTGVNATSASGQGVLGLLRNVAKDGKAGVQITGVAKFPYASPPSTAYLKKIVAGSTAGEVRVADMTVAAEAIVAAHKIIGIEGNFVYVLLDGAVS